jgi:hypothetical protein
MNFKLFIMVSTLIAPIDGLAAAKKRSGPSSVQSETLDFEIDLNWSFGLKTGMATVSSDFASGVSESLNLKITDDSSILTNVIAELQWFYRKNLAAIFGYRLITASNSTRPTHQSSFAGITYFPTTLGIPVIGRRSYNVVKYDFPYKPFLTSSFSIGRQTIATQFNETSDISTEFYGIGLGGGVHFGIAERYAIELSGMFERAIGFSPVIEWGSNNIYALIGVIGYY